MDDKKERTLYCGNISEKVTEDLLYELFLQAGPLESVRIPKDKDGRRRNFAFITFKHDVSVPYTVALMQGISLYGKQLRLELRTGAESEHNPYLDAVTAHQRSFSCPSKVLPNFQHSSSANFIGREDYTGKWSPNVYNDDKGYRFNDRPEAMKSDRYQNSTPKANVYHMKPNSPSILSFSPYPNVNGLSPVLDYKNANSSYISPDLRVQIQLQNLQQEHLRRAAQMSHSGHSINSIRDGQREFFQNSWKHKHY